MAVEEPVSALKPVAEIIPAVSSSAALETLEEEEPVSLKEQPTIEQTKRGHKRASIDEPAPAPIEQPTPKRGRSAASKSDYY